MNITHGDDNLIVRYIQAFLQENYQDTLRVSGIYDEYTHRNLINYLTSPNVSSTDKVCEAIFDRMPEFERYFYCFRNIDEIEFVSKTNNKEVKRFLHYNEQSSDEASTYNKLTKVAKSHGWVIKAYIATDISSTDKYKVILTTNGETNIIPKDAVLPMVNLFNNHFYSNFEISDDGHGGGFIRQLTPGIDDNKTQLAYIECEENTTYTICHGYPGLSVLTICSYCENIDTIGEGKLVSDVQTTYLSTGVTYQYTTSPGSKYMLIQIPMNRILNATLEFNIDIKLGDVNLDGNVTQEDVDMLAYYLTLPDYSSDPTELTKGKYFNKAQFYAANLEYQSPDPGIGNITYTDLDLLTKYVNGEIEYIRINPDTGYPQYTRSYLAQIDNSKVRYANIICVTKGAFTDQNFPAKEFSDAHWAIHDTFIDYLLQIPITKYSDEEDIAYIQDKLTDLTTPYNIGIRGIYQDCLINFIKDYQHRHGILFETGYIDKITEDYILQDYRDIQYYGR